MPAFAALYAWLPTPPMTAAGLVVAMITPERCGRITRAACFMHRNTPRRSIAQVASTAAMSAVWIGPYAPEDACVGEHDVHPADSDTARSTAAATSASDDTSARIARAFGPMSFASSSAACLDVGQHDAGTVLDGPADRPRADAAGPAGDDGYPALQPGLAHRVLLNSRQPVLARHPASAPADRRVSDSPSSLTGTA